MTDVDYSSELDTESDGLDSDTEEHLSNADGLSVNSVITLHFSANKLPALEDTVMESGSDAGLDGLSLSTHIPASQFDGQPLSSHSRQERASSSSQRPIHNSCFSLQHHPTLYNYLFS
jgi:hypothetical protein